MLGIRTHAPAVSFDHVTRRRSESQGLLQAAAGTGFIGFSAFEAGGSAASAGYDAKAAGRVPGSRMQDGSSKTQGVSSTKSVGRERNKGFKVAGGHGANRSPGQVLAVCFDSRCAW